MTASSGFPTAPFGIVVDGNTANEEVMLVTATVGAAWVVTRAQDGTGATPGSVGYAHADLAAVENDVTASYITNINTFATGHAHTGSDQSSTVFDSTAPTTHAFGDVAAPGTATVAAHKDHVHGMPIHSPYYSLLPNGGFEAWQYSTSVAAPANAAFVGPDLWQWTTVGTGVVTVSQSSDVPTVAQLNGLSTPYSMLITPTTADASLAAGDLYSIYTILEGYDSESLVGGFSISFWVKAHLTGSYTCSVFDGAASRNYMQLYTVNSADTWEYKTITVPTLVGTGGAISLINGRGFWVNFPFGAGSSFTRTADGAWGTSSFYAATGHVNVMASTANVVRLWGINVIPGPVAYPYRPLPWVMQLQRCMRYYQLICNTNGQIIANGNCINTTTSNFARPFVVPFGGTPTMFASAGSTFNVTTAAGANNTVSTISSIGADPITMGLQTVAGTANLVAGNATYLSGLAGASLAFRWNP